jgi:hypothetical protein
MRSIARTRRVELLGLWVLDDHKLRSVVNVQNGTRQTAFRDFEHERSVPLIGPRSLMARRVICFHFFLNSSHTDLINTGGSDWRLFSIKIYIIELTQSACEQRVGNVDMEHAGGFVDYISRKQM